MALLVQIPAAIETCVTLNHWHDAVELAKKYNQPTQVGRRNIIFFENATGSFNRFVRSPVKCLL